MKNISVQNVKVTWNSKTYESLRELPFKMVFAMASKLQAITTEHIPRRTGDLRSATSQYGIRTDKNSCSLGSPISYAKSTYMKDDETTNWTTPDTHSHWFDKYWDEQHDRIIKEAVEEYKI